MSTKYRAQILLEPVQHEALAEIAQRENRSISDLVREILREWLVVQDQEAQSLREQEALEALSELRLKIHEQRGVYAGNPIEEVRAERDEETDEVWRGER